MNNGGLPGSVIPDAVAPLSLVVLGGEDELYPASLFYEVKAVTGALTLSTSQNQILGFIDVLATSAAAVSTMPSRPPPELVFTTTANTAIGPSMVTYANGRGVAIWQQKVYYDANSSKQNPDLYIQTAQCVNPTIYPTPIVWARTYPHSPLTSPTTPLTDLIVPNDPDPDSATVD
jgi:hypothetical protein